MSERGSAVTGEKPDSRVLVVETDDMLRDKLCAHFTAEGYQVDSTGTGRDAIGLAQKTYPSLILLALGVPDMPGPEVFRQLRSQPRTGHIPIMVLASRDELSLQKTLLEEGAYDFIDKPLDLDILTLRVRNALRRAAREGLTELRTGLPTGRLIDERLAAFEGKVGGYRLDVSVKEFNVFRDQYGFVTANEALRFAGNTLLQLVNEYGNADDFVGHRANSETFVIITTQACGAKLREKVIAQLANDLHSFYNFVDRDQGFVWVDDGSGGRVQKPLMSVETFVEQGPPDPDAPGLALEVDPWEDVEESEQSDGGGGDTSPFSW